MIEEQAVVLTVYDDAAELEVVRRTACSLCGQSRGCGVALFGRLFRHHSRVFSASNTIGAQPGDHVMVAIAPQALLVGALKVYAVPLLSLLLGSAAGSVLGAGADLYAVLGAVAGLALGMLWVRLHSMGASVQFAARPQIVSLLPAEAVHAIHFK
ncbi:SoxR reducing system RseC family protein [Methylobacillus flagellatus]|uniref:SoxR reducing system RseC family protein n=1 Tax=Methylobacillus flagellatus TaxID=405 RepID=UPI0010F6F9BE|nr:SoxR reducing system RseC family protein [Methylobacillus flagellatus]